MTTSNNKIQYLIYAMFFVFAMTTDSIGLIIPEVIKQFKLSLSAASSFHYTTMISIALSGILLGFLTDRIGSKGTIIIGLSLYSTASILFVVHDAFNFFIILLAISGAAIGLFKIASLALIGTITDTAKQHTKLMNTVEGYFALGAIIGPALTAILISNGLSWQYLYILAGMICCFLIIITAITKFPQTNTSERESVTLKNTLTVLKSKYAWGFSGAIGLYVAVEVAIYVWMPTLLKSYTGSFQWITLYALTIFFILRAAGRFLAIWILDKYNWTLVMLLFSIAIFICFLLSVTLGTDYAIFLLPLSGLFMSMIYPTLNSKGISCFPKSDHGSIAGVILFFTAFAAAVAPLAMGFISDYAGDIKYGFHAITGCAFLLFIAMFYNWFVDPCKSIESKDIDNSTD